MSWFYKNKTLGKYVKYSKHTTKTNPDMIIREFDFVIEKLRNKLNELKHKVENFYFYAQPNDLEKIENAISLGELYRYEGNDGSNYKSISIKNIKFNANNGEIYKGIDAITKIFKKYEMTINAIKDIEYDIEEAVKEKRIFIYTYKTFDYYR